MLAWRNVQYAAEIGAEFLLRMMQRPACLVVGYDDSLPVGVGIVVAVSSANGSAVDCRYETTFPEAAVEALNECVLRGLSGLYEVKLD